jgi:hypothetical protein
VLEVVCNGVLNPRDCTPVRLGWHFLWRQVCHDFEKGSQFHQQDETFSAVTSSSFTPFSCLRSSFQGPFFCLNPFSPYFFRPCKEARGPTCNHRPLYWTVFRIPVCLPLLLQWNVRLLRCFSFQHPWSNRQYLGLSNGILFSVAMMRALGGLLSKEACDLKPVFTEGYKSV